MHEYWRCRECGYMYDPAEGDPDSRVTPETAFALLPPEWRCPVCNEPLAAFEPMA